LGESGSVKRDKKNKLPGSARQERKKDKGERYNLLLRWTMQNKMIILYGAIQQNALLTMGEKEQRTDSRTGRDAMVEKQRTPVSYG